MCWSGGAQLRFSLDIQVATLDPFYPLSQISHGQAPAIAMPIDLKEKFGKFSSDPRSQKAADGFKKLGEQYTWSNAWRV